MVSVGPLQARPRVANILNLSVAHLMLSQLVKLLLVMVAAWLVLAWPAYFVGGPPSVVGMTVAVLVCLVPGVFVLAIHAGVLANQPPLSNLLVSMGLRMAFVLTAVFVSRQLWPELPVSHFVAWLVPSYLVALAVETRIALAQGADREQLPANAARLRTNPLNQT